MLIFKSNALRLHLIPSLVAKFKHKHEYGELNAIWRNFFPGPNISFGKQTWAVGGGGKDEICHSLRREPQTGLKAHRWLLYLLPLFILPKKLNNSEMCQRGTQLGPCCRIPDIPDTP